MTKHVVITGANRGIGLGLVKYYLDKGDTVAACCRQPSHADELNGLAKQYTTLSVYSIDVESEASISDFVRALGDAEVDLVINNAGYYGPKGYAFGQVNTTEWHKVFAINAMGPLLVAQHLAPLLAKCENSKLVCLSSKMGSMTDNTSGGSYLYRSSKSALNAVVKSLSIDLLPQNTLCVVLHPGWVQTEMGGPNALITVEESVHGMAQTIAKLTLAQTGQFFNYNGETIPW